MLPTTYSLFSKASSTPFVTPVLTVHATYAQNDYVGTSGVPMEFTGCGNSGWIVGANFYDFAAQSKATELWLFNATVTPPNDSAAFAISDADLLKCVGVISFAAADYKTSANNSFCRGAAGSGLEYTSASGSLFGLAKLTDAAAPTWASGDISFGLSIVRRNG